MTALGADALPTLDEVLSGSAVVSVQLTTRFRGVEHREAVLLRGPAGWSEFSPFAEYGDAEAATWLAAALDFGWRDSGAAVLRRSIPVNATLPAVAPDRIEAVLARYDGCRTVKIKVAERGQTLADDVERVRETRRLIGAEGRIRLDANGAWNLDEAEHAVRELEQFDLEYVEQPCASVEELAELRRRIHRIDVLVAADESVRKAADPLAVARAGAADVLVIKAAPLGGVDRALAIVEAAGLPAVVSSALDTSVGLAMGAALAARLPALEFDCGLGTGALLADDVAVAPVVPVTGAIGTGRATVDEDALRRLAAPDERAQWWRARLERCYALLAAPPA
ncbi:o-succinylbenzoate synthase [Yonghaparkia sp. Root332]|uniref:o-succinylbenzoate synthase n=1 Tax=Yonghaparkia sp. Root332 TaxID=1736516 RepID=UPI000701481E|nr:o-succinylbenzoate synthase [Yonghaparkia sp. Root332]KQV25718.1 O-succinylbenzoate synthase [Yonghaparkia sp. Root332]